MAKNKNISIVDEEVRIVNDEVPETLGIVEEISVEHTPVVQKNLVTIDLNDPSSLRLLKQALEKTALSARANGKTVTLRSLNDDYVVAIKPARSINVIDPETGKMNMKHKINIALSRSPGYIDMDYVDFMSLERVTCDVISEQNVDASYEDGVVWSNEMKREVPFVVTAKRVIYLIKTPTGQELNIDQDAINL